MSEPVESVVEPSGSQSAPVPLLARICVSVLAVALLVGGLIACAAASKFGVMFAELGKDAELPVFSAIAANHSGVVLVALMALSAVTLFFIWAKGKRAMWMAGSGLLLMAVFVPVLVFALFFPLTRIMTEMGNR